MTTYNNKHPLDVIKILNEYINDLCKVNFTELVDLKITLNIKPKLNKF